MRRSAPTAPAPKQRPKERSDGLPPPAAADKASHGGRYFVDFRARTAASYGHAFLWYGRLKEDGRVGAVEVAGLHPATDSVVPYILGHIIPVPAETGKSYGDLDEQYLTASYRVYLTDAQAKHVFALHPAEAGVFAGLAGRHRQLHRVHLGRCQLHGAPHAGDADADVPREPRQRDQEAQRRPH